MKIRVCFTPAEIDAAELGDATAIVIDAVRATACMVEAMANGAACIRPAVSVDQARRVQWPDGLLCGEREGIRIAGFDLGNSPAEFSADRVAGRSLVMTTTNGTRALVAAKGARRVIVASFMNVGAVARAVQDDSSVVIVCAGRKDRFALDDTLCAGEIVRRICEEGAPGAILAEDAAAAADLARLHRVSAEWLAGTAAGRALVNVGLGRDLHLCAAMDRHKIVPMMQDEIITVAAR